jgi:dipeptidyl aminopeptidase/acylaminoacyl peptidase
MLGVMRTLPLCLLLLAASAFAAAPSPSAPAEAGPAQDGVVRYRDRAIDVKAYLEGFPWKSFYFAPEAGKLFFLNRGAVERLHEAPLEPGKRADLAKARVLSDVDFTKRNLWGLKVSRWNGKVYVKGDEDNREIINIYELQADGSFKKLTSEGYIYDWALSPDGRRVAFAARSGATEFTPGSVGILDLETGAVRKVFTDSKALRMTWTTVSWKPDGTAVALGAVCDEDRTRQELLLVQADGSGHRGLLGCDKKRSVSPTWDWLDDGSLLYTSDEPGNTVAYRLDLATGESAPLTDPKWNLESAQLLGDRLVALEKRPVTTALHVVDPRDGKRSSTREFPASLWAVRGTRERMFLNLDSVTVPYEGLALRLEGGRPRLEVVVDYGDELKKRIVHCDARKVSFKTFDGYAAPGEDGTLHAFLYTPRAPAKGAQARLLVNSFYGGTNSWYPKLHMFCQAGFHVLSPAPRGSWDWGREFHDKMQGDLGGGEILDVVEAAKAFSKELGIPPAQVGAFGGSHGGYATLRALTLPDEVNGHAPGFRFGFGLSDYGISDLVRYVKNCNIPGWITDMTREDPAKNPEKWLDRSPQTHACRASGPLFLSHGSNDKRVGIEESEAMMAALRKCGRTRDVFYKLPGQGHGYKGTPVLIDYYREMFKFLEGLEPGQTAAK